MLTAVLNGTLVTADRTFRADVLIEGEKIRDITDSLPPPEAANVIDASGLLVMPGGVDAHTHLDMPLGNIRSSDDFETGTRAAAFGGTTTIVDFATQPRGTNMRDAFEMWLAKAEGKATIDYGLHMIVTDLGESGLEDVDALVDEGITSFKLFMAYPHSLMVDDGTILRMLQRSARNGALISMHAENGGAIDVLVHQALAEGKRAPVFHALTRPVRTESEAVHRAIALAEICGAPVYIVHVSSGDALDQIRRARECGLPVFGETCPQYLLLSTDDLARPGFEGAKFVLTPPLRDASNHERLWTGLRDGSLQVAATDHCPFNFARQKTLGRDDFTKIPNGGPGIENRMELIYHYGVNQGRLSLNRFVEVTATAPARMFGLYPHKGEIAVGSDADLVLWDPQARHTINAATHHMRVDYSMFEGIEVTGKAHTVISRGETIVAGGRFLGRAGRGRYLRRSVRQGA